MMTIIQKMQERFHGSHVTDNEYFLLRNNYLIENIVEEQYSIDNCYEVTFIDGSTMDIYLD